MFTFSTEDNSHQPHLSPHKSDVNDDAAAQPNETFVGVVSAWEAAEGKRRRWGPSPGSLCTCRVGPAALAPATGLGILLLLLHAPTALPFLSLSLNPPHLGLSHPYSHPHRPLGSVSADRIQILLPSALKLVPG